LWGFEGVKVPVVLVNAKDGGTRFSYYVC